MRASDYIASLNLPPLGGTYGPGWYSAGTARIYVLPDGGIWLYGEAGNASFYDATADDFKGLCKVYRVELPPAPDEVYDEHSPVVDAVTECFACGSMNDEQGVCTRDGCCDSI